ncbi:phospholipase A [Maribacter sp. 2307ULW6-5]|uniref:phospholipase A n=1 Tax=Maribacter sp. 2307ULW6-5 TaxID=3386275 RepID=UPI0039BC7D37
MSFSSLSPFSLLMLLFPLVHHTPLKAQDDAPTLGKFVGGKSMAALWELEEPYHQGTFVLSPYRPLYFLLGKWSNDMNRQPKSVGLDNALESPVPYDNVETAFQLSVKTKVFHNILWNSTDVWFAFTQSAFYQLYNKTISRPMRELNYEPEIILNFPVRYKFLGLNGRMLGLSLNHESNGLDVPGSRSWNRLILMAGLEKGPWQVYAKTWIRLPSIEEGNPEIMNYLGRGELRLIRDLGKHRVQLIGKHSLNWNENRGSLRLDWTFPVKNNLNGYLRVFSGYGESMIDYNHLQTTVGLGMSFID